MIPKLQWRITTDTPIAWAAISEHERGVKILPGRDGVNPNKPDNGGQRPHSLAVRNGRGGVVKILVGRDDINLDKPDNGGRMPLSWAAVLGQGEVVKVLQ